MTMLDALIILLKRIKERRYRAERAARTAARARANRPWSQP